MHQKHLATGLRLFNLSEDEQVAILSFLETEEEQIQMVDYLLANPNATAQNIMTTAALILKTAGNSRTDAVGQ